MATVSLQKLLVLHMNVYNPYSLHKPFHTHTFTGIIMVEMQETERAVQLFSKLTTLDPDNESVKQQLRNLQLHQTY